MIDLFKIQKFLRKKNQTYKVPGTLQGTFTFGNGTISGEFVDHHNLRPAIMTVVVSRFGKEILSATAERLGKTERYSFKIPIDNAFSPSEFISEKVLLLVRSSIGATGKLRLDGTAGIELIREYLGAPTSTLCDINFVEDGNSSQFAREGWYEPGKTHTFTEGTDSFIALPPLEKDGKHALRLLTGALIYKPFHPFQDAEMFLNNELIWRDRLRESYIQFFEAKFEAEKFLGEKLELRIHHPNVVRPCDIFDNTKDPRRLALSVRRVTLVRFLEQS